MNIMGIFNHTDRIQIESLNQRHKRAQVISSNIVNAETPGFRSIGYDFEEGLQLLSKGNESIGVKVTDPRHKNHEFVGADGTLNPDVYLKPTASIGGDGNTVDMDAEMTQMAQNQILYRSTVESLNRKIGMIRYAIQGGR